MLDYKPFETWADEGSRDTQALAQDRVRTLLNAYQAPAIDPGVNEALSDYVRTKKDSMADAFT